MTPSPSQDQAVLKWLQFTEASNWSERHSDHDPTKCHPQRSPTQNKPQNLAPPINVNAHVPYQLDNDDQHHPVTATHHHNAIWSRNGLSKNSRNLPDDEPVQYARQPQRKTRADKYDFQNIEKQQGQKRKWQETSGTALLRRYNADNVVANRLTLRPTSNLGLFCKGRASSSASAKLQDLAIFNVKILAQRGSTEVPAGKPQHSRIRGENARDHEDLSRFFAGIDTTGRGSCTRNAGSFFSPRVRDAPKVDKLFEPSIPPFLGFGQASMNKGITNANSELLVPSESPINDANPQNYGRSSHLSIAGGVGVGSADLPKAARPELEKCATGQHVKLPTCGNVAARSTEGSALSQQVKSHVYEGFEHLPGLLNELSRLIEKWQDALRSSKSGGEGQREAVSIAENKHQLTHNGRPSVDGRCQCLNDNRKRDESTQQLFTPHQVISETMQEDCKEGKSLCGNRESPCVNLRALQIGNSTEKLRRYASASKCISQRLPTLQGSSRNGIPHHPQYTSVSRVIGNPVSPMRSIYQDQAENDVTPYQSDNVRGRLFRGTVFSKSSFESYLGNDFTRTCPRQSISSPMGSFQAESAEDHAKCLAREQFVENGLSDLDRRLAYERIDRLQTASPRYFSTRTSRTLHGHQSRFPSTFRYQKNGDGCSQVAPNKKSLSNSTEDYRPRTNLGVSKAERWSSKWGVAQSEAFAGEEEDLKDFWTPQKLY